MVGTSPNVRGGIASLVRSYYNSGLFRRFDMRYVPTHCDGTAAQKAVTALKAYVSLSSLLLSVLALPAARPRSRDARASADGDEP